MIFKFYHNKHAKRYSFSGLSLSHSVFKPKIFMT